MQSCIALELQTGFVLPICPSDEYDLSHLLHLQALSHFYHGSNQHVLPTSHYKPVPLVPEDATIFPLLAVRPVPHPPLTIKPDDPYDCPSLLSQASWDDTLQLQP